MGHAPDTLETEPDFILWAIELQQTAYDIRELPFEDEALSKAARFLGAVVTGSEVSVELDNNAPMSLLESLCRAKEGDHEALLSVIMNVKTDVIERSIKAGHVMQVTQTVDAKGRLTQHGQSARSIQANSLRFASQHPQMLPRTKAETRNLFRIEDAMRLGLLKDYYVVVPSRPSDDMTEADMHAQGFFIDTMSIALQVSTEGDAGELITETAFVAGKRNRTAPRHDAKLVQRLATQINIAMDEMSATETLDRPWLVPKSMMPHGVIDLVRLADECMGTFFGEDRPVQDYVGYLETCKQRERDLETTVQEIVAELLADVYTMATPLDATRRLHELSESKLVRRALYDSAIDTTVFGTKSAQYIQAARYHLDRGEFDKVDEFMNKAEKSADTSSCPGGGGSVKEVNSQTPNGGASSNETGDCEFVSKECPLCHKKNVKTTVKKLASGKTFISGRCGCTKIA